MGDLLAGISTELLLAAVGGLVCVVLIAVAARNAFGGRRDEVMERLERTTHGMDLLPIEQKTPEKTLARIASILRPFARLATPSQGEELSRIHTSLIQAGYRNDNAVEVFLGIKLLLTPIAILLLWQINIHLETPFVFPMSFCVAMIACAVAFFLPNIFVGNKRTNRQMTLENPLPDAIDLLVTCVEAGLSLDAAMARVSQEMELVAPLLAQELKQTMLEIQAGVKRSDAFHRLSARTGVEDLKSLSAMIIQTELFGTSVSRALRVHSEGMRTKRMQRAEEKAAMVSVKMTVPLIFFILPSLMIVVMGPAALMIMGSK
ncbi:MAG TPA: type II secretion system F family protein [Polyangia bacterium]|jgi:tight adherence protein C|nr:type II secretion system F family protein [Polyangia bacterium]